MSWSVEFKEAVNSKLTFPSFLGILSVISKALLIAFSNIACGLFLTNLKYANTPPAISAIKTNITTVIIIPFFFGFFSKSFSSILSPHKNFILV